MGLKLIFRQKSINVLLNYIIHLDDLILYNQIAVTSIICNIADLEIDLQL